MDIICSKLRLRKCSQILNGLSSAQNKDCQQSLTTQILPKCEKYRERSGSSKSHDLSLCSQPVSGDTEDSSGLEGASFPSFFVFFFFEIQWPFVAKRKRGLTM